MNSILHDTSIRSQNSHPANATWRVVIADDETLPAELLKRTLIRLGHIVVGSARNGVEAIAFTRELHPDVVIMDLRMPVMDGWTAMAELKRDMLAPVVVASALDDRESLEQAIFAGASAFLTKPVREDELERALGLAIARFADMQEIRKWRADAERRAQEQATERQELERVIHQLRETQFQLVSAARRAAVTSLAHGLAHEINNALTPIIGNAQIVKMLYESDTELGDRTQQIIDHAQQIANWTASFRQVTTERKQVTIPYSLNGILHDVIGLYADRFQRLGIQVITESDMTLPLMEGRADQMQEVWMSLVQNAVEAMPQGGTIVIRTQYDPAQARVIATLTDRGTGILAKHLPLVFEPGFTTKGATGGDSSLGWGLFTVKQIVNAHSGQVDISSPAEDGARGTTVRVTLPASPDSSAVN